MVYCKSSLLQRTALLSFFSALIIVGEGKSLSGTNADGFLVKCFDSGDKCLTDCIFTCTPVDHCKGSEKPMFACSPSIWIIISLLSLVTVLGTIGCCLFCFCAPFCICYQRFRRKRRQPQHAGNEALMN